MKSFIGKKVKQDIVNSVGLVLIPAKATIGTEELELIQMHRVDMSSIVWEMPAKSVTESSEVLMQQTVKQAKQLFQGIQAGRKIPVHQFREEIIPAVQQLTENPNIFELFEAVRAKDDYTHQHNIGVGALSTLIGKWMNLSSAELATLSLAATLHDVGKVKIPLEILNKPGKLTKEEYTVIKQHTVFGYEMLRDTVGVGHRVASVAIQHHEREDGRGYPFGLKRDQIDVYSKIVAIADIFHAMSSKRPYHEPMPFYEIIKQMREGTFGEFEPEIISVFLSNITGHLIGNDVLLSDGRRGEVIYINPHDIGSPLVKVGNAFVDLSKQRNIQIQSILA
ncbi:HD-GYP domain-containing protein [Paenibacillus alba]|uniref:HD-GYP domain-containing protein n=1 Tax=Paenibacillus alba TaxID=1197127 RepID=A0ABU6G523_9BACL|nr:HD-GYP domain-containing protein [Paenibacillus alba]MEC0229282.1 HD-GYP domain-containing protein [Paenibacillus alba]NQX65687.1 HD-GYP domain-containing protein [Paenibacillus alba]